MRLARTLQVSTLFALVLPLNAHIHPDLSPFLGSSVEASLDASSFGSPEERLHGNKARTGSNVPHGTSHDEHRIMRQIVRRALDSTSKIVRHDAEQARRNNELKRKQTRRQLRQLRLTNASTGELSNQVHKDAWEQVKNLRKKVATKDNLKGKQKAQGRMLHLSGRSSVKQARRVKKYIQMKVPKAQAKLRQGQRQQAQAQMVQMVKSAGNKKLLIPMHKSRLKKTELKLQQLAQRLLLVQHQSRVAEQNVAISHSLKYSIHSAKQGLSRSQHSISRIRQLMRSLKKKRKRIVARLQTFKNQSIEDTALDKQVAKSISVNVNQQLSSLQEQVVALGNSSATLSNGSNRFNTRLAKVSGTKVPGVDSKVIHAAATLAKSMKNAKPSPRKKLIQNVVFHTKNLQTQMVEDKWRRQQQTSPLEEEIQDVTIVIDHAQETQKSSQLVNAKLFRLVAPLPLLKVAKWKERAQDTVAKNITAMLRTDRILKKQSHPEPANTIANLIVHDANVVGAETAAHASKNAAKLNNPMPRAHISRALNTNKSATHGVDSTEGEKRDVGL